MGKNTKLTSKKGTSALLGVGIVAKKATEWDFVNEPQETAEVRS